MDIAKISQAAEELRRARERIVPLLESAPDIQLSLSTSITRLVNGLCVVAGRPVEEEYTGQVAKAAQAESKPLTHIAGVPIARQYNSPVSEAIPTEDEILEVKYQVSKAREEVLHAEPKELLGRYGKTVIAGLGKVEGVEADGEKIDEGFVRKIQEAIRKKEGFDSMMEDIKKASVSAEEMEAEALQEETAETPKRRKK